MDMNVVKKEDKKVGKYLKLAQEIRKMHKVNTEIIPIVIGALGTVPKLVVFFNHYFYKNHEAQISKKITMF